MLDRPSHTIRAWGFSEPPPSGTPVRLALLPTEPQDMPPDELLLVSSRAAVSYMRLASKLESRPKAVLYLETGDAEPQGSWRYFRDVVESSDWEHLRRLAACPRQLSTLEAAHELPGGRLSRVVEALDEGTLKDRLPFLLPEDSPDDLADHLTRCAICLPLFTRVVQERAIAYELALHPPIAEVGSFALGMPVDDEVAQHIRRCRTCQGRAAVLHRVAGPEPVQSPARVWQSLPIKALAALKGNLRPQAQATRAALEALAGDFAAAVRPMRPAPREMPSAMAASGPLTITLSGETDELRMLEWDGGGSLRIGDILSETGKIGSFTLELRRGDATLWSAASEAGQVTIPLDRLAEAIDAGADILVLLTDDSADRGS